VEAIVESRLQIERRRDAFADAFNREDLRSLGELCADDVVMMPPNQPPLVGVAVSLEWWATGFAAFRSVLHIIPRELYVTDGWAFDWVDWAMTIVPLNGAVTQSDHGSSFWLWRHHHDGVWRIIRAMWNSSSETPSLWAGGVANFPADEFPVM
jgi:ketosteroid isomerase-like protein